MYVYIPEKINAHSYFIIMMYYRSNTPFIANVGSHFSAIRHT